MKTFKKLDFDVDLFKEYILNNIGDFEFNCHDEHIGLTPKNSKSKFSISIYTENSDIYCITAEELPKEYLSFKFNMVDFNYIVPIYHKIISIGEYYHFYKTFDHSKNLNAIKHLLSLEPSYKSISCRVPYDVSASLSTGRGGLITGDIEIKKNYFLENDFSISEFVYVDFATRLPEKISLGILNKCGTHHVYLSLKDSEYDFYEVNEIYPLIDSIVLDRYQKAVKKQLGIKNAPYNDEYLTLLQMVKI